MLRRIIGTNRTGVQGENRGEGGLILRDDRTDGFSESSRTEGGPPDGRTDEGRPPTHRTDLNPQDRPIRRERQVEGIRAEQRKNRESS